MRKLLLPLFACLLLLSAVAVPAQALTLPLAPLAAPDEEAGDAAADDEGESEEGEESDCIVEDAEDAQFCAEVAQEEQEEAKEAEECVIKDATAKVAANPGNGTVSLSVRYRAYSPASVAIDARLRGGKGGVHLGASHARFRRAGIFRDTFVLGEKRMERALTAREFEVELQAVNTPRYCKLDLNGALRRAKRSLREAARYR